MKESNVEERKYEIENIIMKKIMCESERRKCESQ